MSKNPPTKRGPYNKTVWAEPREHLSVWPTKKKSAQWKTLAKAKKRPVSAMIVDAMEKYMEENE